MFFHAGGGLTDPFRFLAVNFNKAIIVNLGWQTIKD
jgi:hypothetical protein